MFNTHQYNPKITVPVNLCLSAILYDINHHIFNLLSKYFGVLNWWPLIVWLCKIVPVHFIYSDSKHSFIGWINSFGNKPFFNKLVDEKCCSMSIIKYQWMPKGLWSCIKWSVIFYDSKKFFIKGKCPNKIIEHFYF